MRRREAEREGWRERRRDGERGRKRGEGRDLGAGVVAVNWHARMLSPRAWSPNQVESHF